MATDETPIVWEDASWRPPTDAEADAWSDAEWHGNLELLTRLLDRIARDITDEYAEGVRLGEMVADALKGKVPPKLSLPWEVLCAGIVELYRAFYKDQFNQAANQLDVGKRQLKEASLRLVGRDEHGELASQVDSLVERMAFVAAQCRAVSGE